MSETAQAHPEISAAIRKALEEAAEKASAKREEVAAALRGERRLTQEQLSRAATI